MRCTSWRGLDSQFFQMCVGGQLDIQLLTIWSCTQSTTFATNVCGALDAQFGAPLRSQTIARVVFSTIQIHYKVRCDSSLCFRNEPPNCVIHAVAVICMRSRNVFGLRWLHQLGFVVDVPTGKLYTTQPNKQKIQYALVVWTNSNMLVNNHFLCLDCLCVTQFRYGCVLILRADSSYSIFDFNKRRAFLMHIS